MHIASPVLKLKPGEVDALVESERFVLDGITPIFDIACPSTKTSIDKRIAESVNLIQRGWPRISREFYLDARDLPLEARLQNGAHPMYAIARQLGFHGHRAIHCFGFDRDAAYEQGFLNAVAEGHVYGVAIRLEQHDLKLLDITIDLVRSFLARLERLSESATVVFDLRSIHQSTDDLASLVERAYLRLSKLELKKFILISSAMWDHSLIKTEKVTEVPRTEMRLWEQLRRRGLAMSFGDYGVISPFYVDIERKMKVGPPPKFRFATPSSWWVAKGEMPRKDENSQYPRLARRIIATGQLTDSDRCWGHEQIRAFASYDRQTTNHAGAVAIDTNIHLDVTVRQVIHIENQLAEQAGKS